VIRSAEAKGSEVCDDDVPGAADLGAIVIVVGLGGGKK
jgi:hypothetical protein